MRQALGRGRAVGRGGVQQGPGTSGEIKRRRDRRGSERRVRLRIRGLVTRWRSVKLELTVLAHVWAGVKRFARAPIVGAGGGERGEAVCFEVRVLRGLCSSAHTVERAGQRSSEATCRQESEGSGRDRRSGAQGACVEEPVARAPSWESHSPVKRRRVVNGPCAARQASAGRAEAPQVDLLKSKRLRSSSSPSSLSSRTRARVLKTSKMPQKSSPARRVVRAGRSATWTGGRAQE